MKLGSVTDGPDYIRRCGNEPLQFFAMRFLHLESIIYHLTSELRSLGSFHSLGMTKTIIPQCDSETSPFTLLTSNCVSMRFICNPLPGLCSVICFCVEQLNEGVFALVICIENAGDGDFGVKRRIVIGITVIPFEHKFNTL